MAGGAPIPSTQKYLNILSIQDGIVVLKDGGLRVILKVNSLNFALKSEEEQSGIIAQYQGFLNSIKFPIQIMMQSRQLDLHDYLKFLAQAYDQQTDGMIRAQTEDYLNFIQRLITGANIMDKNFYVVIPYFPSGITQATLVDKILGATKSSKVHYTKEQFTTHKEKLQERVSVIMTGLGGVGLKASQLSTQQIVELLYNIYNPKEGRNERLAEVGKLQAPIVQKEANKEAEKIAEKVEQKAEAAKPGEPTSQAATIGAPVKISGQEFYATPQAVQDVPMVNPPPAPIAPPVAPPVTVAPEAAASVAGPPAEPPINQAPPVTEQPAAPPAPSAPGYPASLPSENIPPTATNPPAITNPPTQGTP